jgi:hypothetical protein
MSSYVITVNERIGLGRNLVGLLKFLSKTTNYVDIAIQKRNSIKSIDEAIEDIENGRTTTYENFEEYKKGIRKILGNV